MANIKQIAENEDLMHFKSFSVVNLLGKRLILILLLWLSAGIIIILGLLHFLHLKGAHGERTGDEQNFNADLI